MTVERIDSTPWAMVNGDQPMIDHVELCALSTRNATMSLIFDARRYLGGVAVRIDRITGLPYS